MARQCFFATRIEISETMPAGSWSGTVRVTSSLPEDPCSGFSGGVEEELLVLGV